MTTLEIMNLDLRKPGSQMVLQDELKKIGPLQRIAGSDDVPLWAIEKMLYAAETKNGLRIKSVEMCPGAVDNYILWRARICESDASKHKDYKPVYGVSIYEVLAKALIKEQSIVRGKEVIQ